LITVLSRVNGELISEHGIVYAHDGYGDGYRWSPADGTMPNTAFVVRYEDEGITWIRDHHTSDSAAVRALRVAHALGATYAEWDR
jgi:hypothetical protein